MQPPLYFILGLQAGSPLGVQPPFYRIFYRIVGIASRFPCGVNHHYIILKDCKQVPIEVCNHYCIVGLQAGSPCGVQSPLFCIVGLHAGSPVGVQQLLYCRIASRFP